jgi:hypothetical protein
MADGSFILLYPSSGRIIGPFDSADIAHAYATERGGHQQYDLGRMYVPGESTLNAAINRVRREAGAQTAVVVAFTPEEAAYVARLVGSTPSGAAYDVARSAYKTLREFDTQAI